MQDKHNVITPQFTESNENVTNPLHGLVCYHKKPCFYEVTNHTGKNDYLTLFEYNFFELLVTASKTSVPININYLCDCQKKALQRIIDLGYVSDIKKKKRTKGKCTFYTKEVVVTPRYEKLFFSNHIKPWYNHPVTYRFIILANGEFICKDILAQHENDAFTELNDLIDEALVSPHAWVFHRLLSVTVITNG